MKNRRTPTDTNENCDMEAVEDKRKTHMGTSKTRSTCMDGEAVRWVLATTIKRLQRQQDYIALAKKSSQGEDF